MRYLHWAGILLLAVLSACQSQQPPKIAVVDGSRLLLISTKARTPVGMLSEAGVSLGAADEVLFNGYAVLRDAVLPGNAAGTLQVRRAVNVTVNGSSRLTTARTVGEALVALGTPLYAADGFSTPPSQAITAPLAVNYTPSKELTIQSQSGDIHARASGAGLEAALATAGMPLIGLDFSKPSTGDPLPPGETVQVVRVSESVVFAEKSIPFHSKTTDSTDVALGDVKIVQPGLPGLAISRVRIRYEDGQEISRQTEAETVVRPPQDRIEAHGTKIELKTATVDGSTIQYWRALQMYATTYSPCNSGTSGCSYGTASGLRAGKGVVAVDPGLYAYLNGQRVYVSGYGRAVIGDIGGGYIIEQNLGVSRYRWIDLGYDDSNIGDGTSGWVTVYFLAPAPATIPDMLK